MDFNYFKENICKTCKSECEKIIVIEKDSNTETMKCLKYERDETKIKGYIRPPETTAKLNKCLMPKLFCK